MEKSEIKKIAIEKIREAFRYGIPAEEIVDKMVDAIWEKATDSSTFTLEDYVNLAKKSAEIKTACKVKIVVEFIPG